MCVICVCGLKYYVKEVCKNRNTIWMKWTRRIPSLSWLDTQTKMDISGMWFWSWKWEHHGFPLNLNLKLSCSETVIRRGHNRTGSVVWNITGNGEIRHCMLESHERSHKWKLNYVPQLLRCTNLAGLVELYFGSAVEIV